MNTLFKICQRCNSTSASLSSKEYIDFGFTQVEKRLKARKVREVFDNVSSKYDVMNDAMSFGVHRLWKNDFVDSHLKPSHNTKLLDMAGGTGDIAFRFLDHVERNFKSVRSDLEASKHTSNRKSHDGNDSTPTLTHHVTVCDINEMMLREGEARMPSIYEKDGDVERLKRCHISWRVGDAECLDWAANNSFDAYTIAFGIRNVTNKDKALREAFRVLKPGGRFLCLEFSHVSNPLLSQVYDAFSFQVIPPLGKVLASDWHSYQYLVESIRKFPDQSTFASMISEAGFSFVTHSDLTFGVACIHSAFKI